MSSTNSNATAAQAAPGKDKNQNNKKKLPPCKDAPAYNEFHGALTDAGAGRPNEAGKTSEAVSAPCQPTTTDRRGSVGEEAKTSDEKPKEAKPPSRGPQTSEETLRFISNFIDHR